jgi:ParB-like chromosome segregation protein Spo0J
MIKSGDTGFVAGAPLIAVQRAESLWVVDGKHRATALQELVSEGLLDQASTVPCIVLCRELGEQACLKVAFGMGH